MKGFVLSSACFLVSLAFASSQYAAPFDSSSEYGLEKFLDPYTLQSLKLKYPKKYAPKMTCARDLALEARYKLASKLLAKQLKNLNGNNNYNLQNQIYGYGQNQPLMVQPVLLPNAASLLQQQQQQSQLPAFQYQLDPIKAASFASSLDSRMTDPRYQQSAIMPQGSLSLSSLHPQQTVLHTPIPVHVQPTE